MRSGAERGRSGESTVKVGPDQDGPTPLRAALRGTGQRTLLSALAQRQRRPRNADDRDSKMTLNDVEELIRLNGLRQIRVHPRRQAACLIPFHRVCGHGDDWETKPSHLFSVANN